MTKSKPNPDRRYARRLDSEAAASIRRDHRSGMSMGELSRRHGVARAAIRAIVEWRTHRPL